MCSEPSLLVRSSRRSPVLKTRWSQRPFGSVVRVQSNRAIPSGVIFRNPSQYAYTGGKPSPTTCRWGRENCFFCAWGSSAFCCCSTLRAHASFCCRTFALLLLGSWWVRGSGGNIYHKTVYVLYC